MGSSQVKPNQAPETQTDGLRFQEATDLSPQLLARLRHTVSHRVLRHLRRHGLLEPHEAEDILNWDHVRAPYCTSWLC